MSREQKPLFDAHIQRLIFADGTAVSLKGDSILAVIGPNNSGKSTTLSEIYGLIYGNDVRPVVLKEIEVRREMSLDEVKSLIKPYAQLNGNVGMPGFSFHMSHIDEWWGTNNATPMGPLFARYLISVLDTRTRLSDCDPAPTFDARTPFAAEHPFQRMYADDALEARVSDAFRRAFKRDMVVHRLAGGTIPVHVGERPIPHEDEDRMSRSYVDRIESLDRLESQGDGVRSLASVVGRAITENRPIQLIDEPEAFLHPPQARVAAEIISEEGSGRQTLIATHSSDVLKGLMNGAGKRVSVIRLRRSPSGARVSHLENEAITALWSDPVLRFSSIMDGLFHDGVIIAEAEADCRFYEAMLSAAVGPDERLDIHYAYSGGKAKVPSIVSALRAVDVPVAAVVDFDVLNNEQPLRKIIEALGGQWADYQWRWSEVKQAVEINSAFIGGARFRAEVNAVLSAIDGKSAVSRDALKQIRELTKNASPWDHIKDGGLQAMPKGQPTVTAKGLLVDLAKLGLFIAPNGEMEGFYRDVQPKGIRWVEEVVSRDILKKPELGAARAFVTDINRFLSEAAGR